MSRPGPTDLEAGGFDLADRLARLLGVPEGSGGHAARLLLTSFALSASLACLKAAQAGIFLEAYPRSMIPWAYAGSAVLLMTLSSVVVSLASRVPVGSLAQAVVVFAMVALVALRGALALHPSFGPFAAYVIIEALCGVLTIQVWATVSVSTDARTARRLLPVAGIGAGLAWTLSGFAVRPLVHLTGAEALLLVAVFTLACTWVCVRVLDRHDITDRRVKRRGSSFVKGWLSGFAFVARSPLMRLMTALAMLALVLEQVMDFHLMATAREELGDAESISAFFGTYFGVTSAISLVLLAGVSSRVMARLGATRALATTPITLTAVAALATALPGLTSAVLLRGAGRVLKQSIWTASTGQLQTPLPGARRSQARAAIRGVLAPGAYVIGALALAALPEHVETRWMTAVTMALAGTMAFIIWRYARRTYLGALHRAVDARSFDLASEQSHDALQDAETCAALSEDLGSEDPARAAMAAELLGLADRPEATEALVMGLAHAEKQVRETSVVGLERHATDRAAEALAARLAEERDADIRYAIVRSVRAIGRRSPTVLEALRDGRDDEDRRVAAVCRAETLATGGFAEAAPIVALLRSEAAAERDAALWSLTSDAIRHEEVVDALHDLMRHPEPHERVMSARVALHLGLVTLLPSLMTLLREPSTAPSLARWVVEVGDGAFGGTRAADASIATVAHATQTAGHGRRGRSGELIRKLLRSSDAAVRHPMVVALGAAIRAGAQKPLTTRDVAPMIERETQHAYLLYSVLAGLARDDGVPDWEVEEDFAFLAGEVELRIEATRRAVLDLLLLLGRKRLVAAVEIGRRGATKERDAQITELVAAALPRALARTVVPLFERTSLRERVRAGGELGLVSQRAIEDPLATLVELDDARLLTIAWLTYGERFEQRFLEHVPEKTVIPRFERMRFLRSVPMFSGLSGEDLLSVADAAKELVLDADHVIFRKGDAGDELYLLVEGEVRICDGDQTLATLKEREFFGDLAILDHQPRSADAVCEGSVRLLSLRGADLRGLMATRPQITTNILEVTARRLRAATEGG